MINKKQETISDIVAEMRQDIADRTVGFWADFGGKIARCYADRIEAAHRRDVAELRECLEQAYGDKIGTYTMKGNEVERWRKALREKGGAK